MCSPSPNERLLRLAMLHIACGANTAYLPYVASMLHSLLTHNQGEQITIHFMHSAEMSAADLQRLASLVQGQGAVWRTHLVTPAMLSRFPGNPRFGLEAWYRVLLPELLPEVERVLYLDADTLVLAPLRPLWETDLGERIAAAVHNPMYAFLDAGFMAALGLGSPRDYFNSGVLLLDLKRWRQAGLSAELNRFVASYGEVQNWPDQNALNAVLCRGRCLLLSPVWNAQNVYFDLSAGQLHLPLDAVREIRSNPRIVHFVAPYKPLDYLCKHPWRQHFFTHLSATPWRAAQTNGKNMANRLLRLLPQPFMWMFILVTLPRFKRKLLRVLNRSG